MFRLAVADLDSPSYFVATAAVELGCFEDEGIEVELERIYGAHVGPERLRDGSLHFYGGPAYAATGAFPAWNGAKLLCALAQYSYWFLAVRADLHVSSSPTSPLVRYAPSSRRRTRSRPIHRAPLRSASGCFGPRRRR